MAPPTLAELEEELKRDPRSRRFFELAREYQKLGRLEAAQELCEKGLATFPNNWQARLLLAQMYVAKGDLEAGRDMVEKVLMAMHDSVPANHLAADVYWAMGQKDRSLKHYQIVDLLEPGRAGVRERLAELLLPQPRPAAAATEEPEEAQDFEPLDEPAPPPASPEDTGHQTAAPSERAGQREVPGVSVPAGEISSPAPASHAGALEEEERAASPWAEAEDHRQELEADTASFATVLDPEGSAAFNPPAAEGSPTLTGPEPVPDEAPETAPAYHEEGVLPDEASSALEPAADAASGMSTFTLAELYERQGYPEKAVEIYQRMLLQDPENAAIHGRIRMLLQRMAGEVPEAPPVHREDVEKALRQKRVQALQGWLRRVREGRNV